MNDHGIRETLKAWVPAVKPSSLTGIGVVLIIVFWGLLPVSTPHPHEEYEFVDVEKVETPIVPRQVIQRATQTLARAEATLQALEQDNPVTTPPKAEKNATTPGATTPAAPAGPGSSDHDHGDHEH